MVYYLNPSKVKPRTKLLIKRTLLCIAIFLISRTTIFGELAPFGLILFATTYRKNKLGLLLAFLTTLGALTSGLGIWGLKYILAMLAFLVISRWASSLLDTDCKPVDDKSANCKSSTKFTSLIFFASLALSGTLFIASAGFRLYDTLLLPLECIFATLVFRFTYPFCPAIHSIWDDTPITLPKLDVNKTLHLDKIKDFLARISVDSIEITPNVEVIDKASGKVCKRCEKRETCWTKNFNTTYDALRKLTPTLEEYGTILEEDFPAYFAKDCIKLTHLKDQINESYKTNLKESLKNPPVSKIKPETPSGVLPTVHHSNAPKSAPPDPNTPYAFDSSIESRLFHEFHSRKIRVSNIIAVKNIDGLLEIEVTLRHPFPSETILAICTQTTGYNLRISEIIGETSGMSTAGLSAAGLPSTGPRHRIRIIQKPKFNLNLGISSQSAIPGEKCGDSYSFTKPNEGTCVITLSDGMGNGSVAARYSGATVELIERFLHAGLSKSSSINLVNSVLMLGKSTETFATIDISIINLFSGRMEFVKLGAGSSYIIRRRAGEIERISSTSLPAGILDVTDIETLSTTVTSGDYIIMISDGIENAQNLWLASFLGTYAIKNPQELADKIIERSKIMNEPDAHLQSADTKPNVDDRLALVIEIT